MCVSGSLVLLRLPALQPLVPGLNCHNVPAKEGKEGKGTRRNEKQVFGWEEKERMKSEQTGGGG